MSKKLEVWIFKPNAHSLRILFLLHLFVPNDFFFRKIYQNDSWNNYSPSGTAHSRDGFISRYVEPGASQLKSTFSFEVSLKAAGDLTDWKPFIKNGFASLKPCSTIEEVEMTIYDLLGS